MPILSYKISPPQDKNTISSSANYRIISSVSPINNPVRLIGFSDIIDEGDANILNIIRKIRYSYNRSDWSLWYTISEDILGDISLIDFIGSSIFFEIKYEYSNVVDEVFINPILINSAKIQLEVSSLDSEYVTEIGNCSDELCQIMISDSSFLFKPYEMDSAISVAKQLSYNTNKIFGHDVVYFKTEPDRDSGDFIFREWTLFKTTNRKCLKVLVPNNIFPDNKPMYKEYGVDFEIPFEIHIDHIYFQNIFGVNAQPRKRDYLYFPMLNRMYEIQGSYLFRGFMMEPMYWKIQLVKYKPNSDMSISEDNKKFLDNIIISSTELYGEKVQSQIKDATSPDQFKTISTKFDESRFFINQDIINKQLDQSFKYSQLIEYYYDLSKIKPTLKSHILVNNSTSNSQYLEDSYTIRAYESSSLYVDWMDHSLMTGDMVVFPDFKSYPIKISGPKDSLTDLKHYIDIEVYKNLSFKKGDRLEIVEYSPNLIQLKQLQNAVIYKKVASTDITPNMTFSCIFKVNSSTQTITLLDGYDNLLEKGLIISGSIRDVSGSIELTIKISLNNQEYSFIVPSISLDSWYGLVIPISSEYSQISVNIYGFIKDPANSKNYIEFNTIFSEDRSISKFSFNTSQKYSIRSGNYSICNIRLFNTMINIEDHEFIISQLFTRNESMLELIDNCRPQLNMPFIAINK